MSGKDTRKKGNLFARLTGGGKEIENQFDAQQRIDELLSMVQGPDNGWPPEIHRLLDKLDNRNLVSDEILRLRELLLREIKSVGAGGISYLDDDVAESERWVNAVEALARVELT